MEKREELNSLMEKYKEYTSVILGLDKENIKNLSTLNDKEAKDKLNEENKKVKVLTPKKEDAFYYWNM